MKQVEDQNEYQIGKIGTENLLVLSGSRNREPPCPF